MDKMSNKMSNKQIIEISVRVPSYRDRPRFPLTVRPFAYNILDHLY